MVFVISVFGPDEADVLTSCGMEQQASWWMECVRRVTTARMNISDSSPEVFDSSMSTLVSVGAILEASDGQIRLTKSFRKLTHTGRGKHVLVTSTPVGKLCL